MWYALVLPTYIYIYVYIPIYEGSWDSEVNYDLILICP